MRTAVMLLCLLIFPLLSSAADARLDSITTVFHMLPHAIYADGAYDYPSKALKTIKELATDRCTFPIPKKHINSTEGEVLAEKLFKACQIPDDFNAEEMLHKHISSFDPYASLITAEETPDSVELPTFTLFPDGTLHARITAFQADTADKMLEAAGGNTPKRIILDLRGCKTGDLKGIIRTELLLLKRYADYLYLKQTLGTKRIRQDDTYFIPKDMRSMAGKWVRVPVLTLVDNETAAGGALFARLMQLHNRGVVAGTETGKIISIRSRIPLASGSILTLSTGHILSPAKARTVLTGQTVTPDIPFDTTQDDDMLIPGLKGKATR